MDAHAVAVVVILDGKHLLLLQKCYKNALMYSAVLKL